MNDWQPLTDDDKKELIADGYRDIVDNYNVLWEDYQALKESYDEVFDKCRWMYDNIPGATRYAK